MNRKPPRKLTLHRETLCRLEKEQLRLVHGDGPPLVDEETYGDTCRTRERSSCPPCN
jgi:hypothetical protein